MSPTQSSPFSRPLQIHIERVVVAVLWARGPARRARPQIHRTRSDRAMDEALAFLSKQRESNRPRVTFSCRHIVLLPFCRIDSVPFGDAPSRTSRFLGALNDASILLSGSVAGDSRPRDHDARFGAVRRSGRRDPSTKTVPRSAGEPCLVTVTRLARVPRKPRRAARVFRCFVPLLSGPRQDGAFRHQPGGRVAPQRHQQLARQRHDAPLPRTPVAGADVVPEPFRQSAVRLVPQPAPRHLHKMTCRQPDYAAFAAWGVVFMGFPAGNVGIITFIPALRFRCSDA